MDGEQRKFISEVLSTLACPSLSELSKRFGIPYGTLKCYFAEKRLLPAELFELFCEVGKILKNKFKFDFAEENWGQVKGGKFVPQNRN